MEIVGQVQNGVVVPEAGVLLPEGVTVGILLPRKRTNSDSAADADDVIDEAELDVDEMFEPKSPEQWIADMKAWAESHPPVYHFVDDSRESIYEGCGD